MSIHNLRVTPSARRRPVLTSARASNQLLGQILINRGQLDPGDLAKALALQRYEDVQIGRIFLAHGMVGESALFYALVQQWQAPLVDLDACPPDIRLIDEIGPQICIKYGFVPWKNTGGGVVIATSNPAGFEQIRPILEASFGRVFLTMAPVRRCLPASQTSAATPWPAPLNAGSGSRKAVAAGNRNAPV